MGKSASKEEAPAPPLATASTGTTSTKLSGKHTKMGSSASKNDIPDLAHPQASFLGLPVELRFMIYDTVKDSDLQCHLSMQRSRYLPDSPPRLPLQNLARSCQLLAREIRDHRHSLPASDRYATISIQVNRQGHDVWLSHASCPAKDLAVFNLVYDISISSHRSGTQPEMVFDEMELHLVRFPAFYRLPAATLVHAFCQVRLDRSDPSTEEQYYMHVEEIRQGLEHAHKAKSTVSEGA
ncbi:hypothetical protein Q7P35_010743 [Cladosporium inversicolor]